MIKVVVINGYPRSGKDTFVNICINLIKSNKKYFAESISSIDCIISLADIMGFNTRNKTEKDRNFLSALKNAVEEYCDYTTISIISDLDPLNFLLYSKNIIFVHTREPELIAKLKDFLALSNVKYDFTTLFIKRDEAIKTVNNASDQNVTNFNYDHYITNDSTLDELKKSALAFLLELDPDLQEVLQTAPQG